LKILVALKRVADPDNANKISVGAHGSRVLTTGLEWKLNPFDEYALEAALRLTEDGAQPKVRRGEVVIVTLGPQESDANLRSAMATGADRAVRVEADDENLDGRLVSLALARIVETEKPDLVLMGKQTVDGESNQVGQRLAELLDWPMATFAASVVEEKEGVLRVAREIDGGSMAVRVQLPAVVTVDLRIVGGSSVRSRFTAESFHYNDGVRFAPLPSIMAAKKKKLDVVPLHILVSEAAPTNRYHRFELPASRKAGVKVKDVPELVARLVSEAKVL
jgi:electron transfer flavoprotein beta subunit